MVYETLLLEKTDGIATITINRPRRLNAVSSQLLTEMKQVCDDLRQDATIRFVIITGAGRAFSVGYDLAEGVEKGAAVTNSGQADPYLSARMGQFLGHDLLRALENLEQVTVAAINGHCLGGGLSLAMTCDFRIAVEDASLGVPEANVGVFFTWGCTARLSRLIGPVKTKELIMTCDSISAQEAQGIGLVNKVVPAGELMNAARQLIEKIAAKGPLAIRLTKKITNASMASNFGDIFICEPELVERVAVSGEQMEGMKAFMEKRPPKFRKGQQ